MVDVSLLERAVEAHGGAARWRDVIALQLRGRVRPWLLMAKGILPRCYRFDAQVATAGVRVVFEDFAGSGMTGVFTANRVSLVDAEGRLHGERRVRRGADGRVVNKWRWDRLDLLYFFGYAVWNYHNLPFILLRSDFECAELPPWTAHGQSWQRLQVMYPEGFATHSPRQVLYFDADGLLRRMDYRADVIGSWAVGSQLCGGHRSFDGLVYPTHRKVLGAWLPRYPLPFPPAVEAWVDQIAVDREPRSSDSEDMALAAVT